MIKVIKANKDQESKDNIMYNNNNVPMDCRESISRTRDNYEQENENSPSTYAKN